MSNFATLSDIKDYQEFYKIGILEYMIINFENEKVKFIRTNYLLKLTKSIISAKEDVFNMT